MNPNPEANAIAPVAAVPVQAAAPAAPTPVAAPPAQAAKVRPPRTGKKQRAAAPVTTKL